MFANKNFVIFIGNYGSIIALINNKTKEIENRFFIENLDEETKLKLEASFKENSDSPIYILLDTIDQTYKKKLYPNVSKIQLTRIVKRDLTDGIDAENISNFLVLKNKFSKNLPEISKKWDCLLISSSKTDTISGWIDFVVDKPNNLIGLYMLPIEINSIHTSLFKLYKNKKENLNFTSNPNDLYCYIYKTKVSGVRQVVFSDSGIIFSRVVNYSFEESDFLEKFELDIYSTFEYLKRINPALIISNLKIINIFSEEVNNKIKKTNKRDLNYICYTPDKLILILKLGAITTFDKENCDLLFLKSFVANKKILKFSTAKSKLYSNLFLFLNISKITKFISIFLIAGLFITSFIYHKKSTADIKKLNKINEETIINLDKIRKIAEEKIVEKDRDINIDKIIELGKVHNILTNGEFDIYQFYNKLSYLQNNNAILTSLTIDNSNFFKNKNASMQEIFFSGIVYNKTGNVEHLLTIFDNILNQTKNNLPNKQVFQLGLSKDFDFNKKYYEHKIEYNIKN